MPASAKLFSALLAGTFVLPTATLAVPAHAANEEERCYGIALKGANDCAGGYHACAGLSLVDYDGRSFKLVPAGTCITMQTPYGPGSLEPIVRPS